jgi:hypothetical protein
LATERVVVEGRQHLAVHGEAGPDRDLLAGQFAQRVQGRTEAGLRGSRTGKDGEQDGDEEPGRRH